MMQSSKMKTGVAAAALTGAMAMALTQPALAGYDPYVDDDVALGPTTTARRVTLVGTLVGDANNDRFQIRDSAGRIYTVHTRRVSRTLMPNQLVAGDVVRVYGDWRGDALDATNLRSLGRNYVATGTRVYIAPYTYVVGSRNTYTGTLVTDADDDEFEILTDTGRRIMIKTTTIPDSFGLNQLVEGQRVRVHGVWNVTGDVPTLEATNVYVFS